MTKAKMPVEIRPLRRSDRAAWTGLWTAYLDFYGTVLPDEIFETTFSRLTDAHVTSLQGLVAVADGTPIGLTHYMFHDHCWKPEGICYLQDLYADPQARGMGIGRALIEAVYSAADAQGVPSVYWTTQHFNTVGRQLYDRVGELTPFIKYQRPAA